VSVTCSFLALVSGVCALNRGRAGREITNQTHDSVNRQETGHGGPEVLSSRKFGRSPGGFAAARLSGR